MITYKKHESGWGIQGDEAEMIPGEIVQVQKKDGTTNEVIVGEIISVRNGKAIARIGKEASGFNLF